MRFIFNDQALAVIPRIYFDSGSIPVDVFKTYGTPYGLFIPITSSGFQLIRWLRRDMKDKLSGFRCNSYFLHISNIGEVIAIEADTDLDKKILTLQMIPYCTSSFATILRSREETEAYNVILQPCKTIQEAITVFDNTSAKGFYKPIIVAVSDWVEHAKEQGYDKLLYTNRIELAG